LTRELGVWIVGGYAGVFATSPAAVDAVLREEGLEAKFKLIAVITIAFISDFQTRINMDVECPRIHLSKIGFKNSGSRCGVYGESPIALSTSARRPQELSQPASIVRFLCPSTTAIWQD